ncbi:recombination protein NinB (plasmid) [Skermanella rosea]|uniref:recombination protein NinB n=1 Tax=Skermanella rosea TaxID=1817965 RepID=UPI001E3FB8BA|nr:recombination protein NinB [Skermanella rosea]UEM08093.1 recombination protein NinB [Skermanella rosea]
MAGSPAVQDFIRSHEGEKVRVTVDVVKHARSLSQNAYYHGVVVPHIQRMFEDAGTTLSHDQVHEFLKMHVMKLHKVVLSPDGTPSVIGGSTTSLSKSEFSDKMAQIQQWASEFGYYVPDPNEVYQAGDRAGPPVIEGSHQERLARERTANRSNRPRSL